jgi:hypothetical protein
MGQPVTTFYPFATSFIGAAARVYPSATVVYSLCDEGLSPCNHGLPALQPGFGWLRRRFTPPALGFRVCNIALLQRS